MTRLACVALLATALFPSVAHANSVLTRTSGSGGTYTVTGDSQPDTVTATVSRELVVGRALDLLAPDGQTYTFTTVAPQTFSSTVPTGCTRNPAGTTVTCEGAAVDADHLVMHGGTGDDTLKVVYAGSGVQQGSYDTTDLEGDDGYDTLIGGPGSDTLIASPDLAADTLQGGGGADTISCGDAADGLSYDDPARTVGVTASVGQVSTHAGPDGDQISGPCENLIGSPKADTLIGDDAGNVIRGQAGDDTIQPGLGMDTVYGDDGIDALSCDDAVRTSGVTVDITNPAFGQGCDAGETARTFENVIGTGRNDTITTGPGANRITALAGNSVGADVRSRAASQPRRCNTLGQHRERL